jgi:hypothetical protein
MTAQERDKTMTTAQANYIATLARQLNIGSHASHGIKAVLGKVPVNMTKEKASQVIDQLKSRLAS